MSDKDTLPDLPETGDWKVTEGAIKTTATDISGQYPPRIMERGKLSSRTRARLQPVPEGDKPA